MDQIGVGPEPDNLTGPSRSEPELSAGELQVPGRRDHPVELHRSTQVAGHGARTRYRLGYLVGVAGWFVRSIVGRNERRGQPERQQLSLECAGWSEAVCRADRPLLIQGLVGSVGVVFPDELVDRGLRRGQRLERVVIIEQFPPQGEVEAFDLAGRGRRRRLGQSVRDPVVPADLVEQHLAAAAEPSGELLAVVGQAPRPAHRTAPTRWRMPDTPPGRWPAPRPRRSRRTGSGRPPRSPPSPRGALRWPCRPAITPPTMSSCHSCIGPGRSHRWYEFRGRFRFRGVTTPMPDQDPVHRRVDGTVSPAGASSAIRCGSAWRPIADASVAARRPAP